MKTFSFIVLYVIIPPHNVFTIHISKTHLPIFKFRPVDFNYWSLQWPVSFRL